MFKYFFMAAIALSISASAQQNALSLVKTGKYSYSSYNQTGKFDIVVGGNSVAFKDTENGINYFLNTRADGGAQKLPDEFLALSRRRGASSGIASLVKGIEISDVQVGRIVTKKEDGRISQSGAITGKVAVEIEYSSAFGSMRGTVEMLARVDVTRQSATYYFQDKATGKWINKDVTTSGLRASAGDFLRLTKFESNLPTALNNVLGMVMDIGLRIGSLSLRSTEYIHEVVRP